MYALWELRSENEARFYELYEKFVISQGEELESLELEGQMTIEELLE